MNLSIDIDTKSLDDIRKVLNPAQMHVAMQAAVSRTVTTGKALIARRIGEEVRLKIRDIKGTIDAKRGGFNSPGVISVSKGKGVWLSQFANAGLAKVAPKGGLTIRVRKKPTPKYPTSERHSKAFWGAMPHSSNVGIFKRTGVKRAMKSGRYKGKIREVIKRKRGPSPIGVFLNAKGTGAATVFAEVGDTLAGVLQKNLLSQVDRFIKPKGATDRTDALVRKAESIGE